MVAEPFTLAGLALRNRMVRAGMFEKRADRDGMVTDSLVEFYRVLGAGGAGLVVTGGALVMPSGRVHARMISAHSDARTPGLARLADAIHAGDGCKAALQLTHGGPMSPALLLGGEPALGPTHAPAPTPGAPGVRAATDAELWGIVDAFGSAAFRAQAAGFDAVEIQAGHGHLLDAFLSGHGNARDDYWGGDEERRFHLLEEVMRSTREAVGREFPVIVKLTIHTQADGTGPEEPEDCVRAALKLAHAGADAVEIAAADPATAGQALATAGRAVKAAASLPVILTGGIRTLGQMKGLITAGAADLIGMARPLLRDPALPLKLASGEATGSDCSDCGGCARLARLREVACILPA
jgi:2,4-dienoyl-CoA reductase-like NADH-dependent reductase (Old Yellow Enzyme family)